MAFIKDIPLAYSKMGLTMRIAFMINMITIIAKKYEKSLSQEVHSGKSEDDE